MTDQPGPRNEITWAYLFCYVVGIAAFAAAFFAIDHREYSGGGLCLLAAAVAFGAIAIAANRR